MNERICLITGATDGVGKATAIALAERGFTVVLAARSAAKAEFVKREIASATGRDDVGVLVGSLSSLTQVRRLAETFKSRYGRLDALVNNAGIFAPNRVLTEDGYETTFQVNYLSHFLLTQLLLDALRASSQGRIVNLSSSVYSLGAFDPENLQSERRFSSFGAYAASKLFMLMFSIELAQRLRGTTVTANAAHPGIVRTQMMFTAPGFFKLVAYLAAPFSLSARDGAATSVHLAASPEIGAESGRYFQNCRAAVVRSRYVTQQNLSLLWDLSTKFVADAGAAAWPDVAGLENPRRASATRS